ncbi:MAG: glycosyltransferase, partial [Oxalobacteraceae bacterium]
ARTVDILVLPSHAENFPISIIEALAAEVAVIATPVGATPELLRHGVSALFVPVGDVAALATAIACLIENPALRRSIAAAGHAVFAEQLDIDALAIRLAAMHGALLPC